MVSEELKKNSRRNLFDTLKNLADDAKMRRYKKAVPFVHVPVELACQWDGHNRLFRTAAWFRELFTESQVEAAVVFDRDFNEFLDLFGDDLLDVPEILEHPEWAKISALAGKLAQVMAVESDAD